MTIGKTSRRRGLAAVALVGTALAVLMVPGSASAVTNQLTVVTLTRSGAPLAVRVTAVNLTDNAVYSLTSGTAKTLPAGRYAAMTDIYNPADSTDTLGARIVTVTGSTKITIDARSGRPVGIGLSPEPVTGDHSVSAAICALGSYASAVVGYNSPGKLFVIPDVSSSLQFAAQSTWLVPDASGPGTGYVVVRSMKGVPAGYTPTVAASTLAVVRFDVRRGPAGAPNTLAMVQPAGTGCAAALGGGLANADAPYRLQTHLSPGVWQLETDTYPASGDIGYESKQLSVVAGGQYAQSFFTSVWVRPAGCRTR